MENNVDSRNYENSYINIPLFILQTYWRSDYLYQKWESKETDFNRFVAHVIAFGIASGQLFRMEFNNNDPILIPTSNASEDDNQLFIDFIDDLEDLRVGMGQNPFLLYAKVFRYQQWIKANGDDLWMKSNSWVGVTISNLRTMTTGRFTISRAKSQRWEEMWLIYFGLKSAINPRIYFDCSWDFILTRAMGFKNIKDYSENILNAENWTTQLRNKRRAKDKMIERLIKYFGLHYTPTGTKGCGRKKCRWSFESF